MVFRSHCNGVMKNKTWGYCLLLILNLVNIYISKITHKANSVVVIIKQSFSCLDKAMFHTLYDSLVHPHLVYASQIWNPRLIKDIQALEKVQRHATKLHSTRAQLW